QDTVRRIPGARLIKLGNSPGQVPSLAFKFGHQWFEYFDVSVWYNVVVCICEIVCWGLILHIESKNRDACLEALPRVNYMLTVVQNNIKFGVCPRGQCISLRRPRIRHRIRYIWWRARGAE
ncbi:hypothetical protein GGX14DRAFT_350824, partial [Mycena pura]